MNKEKIIQVIKEMPDDANEDDVIERILFVRSVEESIREFEEGKYYSQSDMENMVQEWKKSYGH